MNIYVHRAQEHEVNKQNWRKSCCRLDKSVLLWWPRKRPRDPKQQSQTKISNFKTDKKLSVGKTMSRNLQHHCIVTPLRLVGCHCAIAWLQGYSTAAWACSSCVARSGHSYTNSSCDTHSA